MSLAEAMQRAAELLENTAESVSARVALRAPRLTSERSVSPYRVWLSPVSASTRFSWLRATIGNTGLCWSALGRGVLVGGLPSAAGSCETRGVSLATHIEVRPQDRPLQEDVRYLASALGQVIKRLEGDAVFQAVEDLRSACRGRRRGEATAADLDTLLARVADFPLEVAAPVARAFTLFFFLINTAEQVHRVRRRQAYEDGAELAAQPASIRWAFEKLRDSKRSAADVREYLRELEVRPVLTAHPTEATRRTLLQLRGAPRRCLAQA